MPYPDLQARPADSSGNAFVYSTRLEDDAWMVEFMSEPRTSPQPLWFHLECACAGRRRVRLLWRNADGCLGLGSADSLRAVRPVLRTDGHPWERARQPRVRRRSDGGLALEFAAPRACERLAAAFSYPYGPAELNATLAATAGAWTRHVVGLTAHGRPLVRLSAGPPSRRRPRPTAFLTARQHAGETPGSLVLDGLLRAVAEDDALQKIRWHVVPFVDLDGVVEGDYGKDAQPWDFNRAWRPMTMRPEVLALQADMRRALPAASPRLLVDLHAPGGAEHAMYAFLPRETRPLEHQRTAAELAAHLTAALGRPDDEPLVRTPRYPSRWGTDGTCTSWAWDGLEQTPAASVETSYQALPDGAWLKPDGYAALGARLARGIRGWLLAHA